MSIQIANQKLQDNFNKMSKYQLFRSRISGSELWYLYLASFRDEDNPVFRDPESSTYNCNTCHNFMRRYGNIIAIDDNDNILTLFDNVSRMNNEYKLPFKALSKALKNAPVDGGIFVETYNELEDLNYEMAISKTQSTYRLGVDKNVKRYTKEEAELYPDSGIVANQVITFEHLHFSIPNSFIDKSGDSVSKIVGIYNGKKTALTNAIENISTETLKLTRDLIKQKSLLNGKSYLSLLQSFIDVKVEYEKVSNKEFFIAKKAVSLPKTVASFRNSLIGMFCKNIEEGKELNAACLMYNKAADPANYMRAASPVTETQKKALAKLFAEKDYETSLKRRIANINDIQADEIKFMNVDNTEVKGSILDNVKTTNKNVRFNKSQLDKVEEIGIEKFMSDVLPTCSSIEVLFENRLKNNLVTLTTSEVKNSLNLFKWDNNYSWTYSNNLAGKSEIKEAVKSKGGNVNGKLRFSIMWSGENRDNSDLDAHCICPNTEEIYFGHQELRRTGKRILDIDIMYPREYQYKNIVENIVFREEDMTEGEYLLFVHQYSNRNSKGFSAEIEINGDIYHYDYNKPLPHEKRVNVAKVINRNGELAIEHILPIANSESKTENYYGIDTNKFHEVSLMCLSPNYWGDNSLGNKHYFFFIKNCICDKELRTFHPENLNAELYEHRKVLEVLSDYTTTSSSKNQLSGLGFNATVANSLIVKCKGNFQRVLKIKF